MWAKTPILPQVGVTSHNPATIRFPSTMTNMDSGTIMMSGCKVLLNGHGMCMEYGNFNLDELRVCTRSKLFYIGMTPKSLEDHLILQTLFVLL